MKPFTVRLMGYLLNPCRDISCMWCEIVRFFRHIRLKLSKFQRRFRVNSLFTQPPFFSKLLDVVVTFEDFPLPPPDNNLYPSFFRRGRIIRVPSKEYSIFRKCVESWAIVNASKLKWAREAISHFDKLGIEFVFQFEHAKIYTKAGTVRKMDVSNRIKAAQDSISKFLQIDDSIFFTCIAHKVVGPKDSTTIHLWGGELELDSED